MKVDPQSAAQRQRLYHRVSQECSALVTGRYSTSFTMGIKLFDKTVRPPVYAIYGFVRLADEIVDSFDGFDQAALLSEFRDDTATAIERNLSLNPVLHAFARVVNEYDIKHEYIAAFFDSMQLDLTKKSYSSDEYRRYIYGSAEVVGLMCLQVFCRGDRQCGERLREPAARLGAAFQKVNFLRDLASDYADRGRLYFPGLTPGGFDESAKQAIEADIEQDFRAARGGIDRLPPGARLGVLLAYSYYRQLFAKLKQLPAAQVAAGRVRLSRSTKALVLARLLIQYRFGRL
ncbi:phytoene/squalene synthase family protein [Candidatus Parcubacteria bacterium]|nr:phytoene/squalene synthase family protein [Candidatus Parcubacteria bacterium]